MAAELDELEKLLVAKAVPRGFVARADAGKMRERHIEDCLRAVVEVRPSDRTVFDLGSGAGLPGLVIALSCPNLEVTLVERRPARAAFLELAVETLGLSNARVWAGEAEKLSGTADLCFARAFAPLRRAWRIARPLLRQGGRLIYFAGEGFEASEMPGATLKPAPRLASGGPLVIMTR